MSAITATIVAASTGVPARSDSSAAAQSNSASGWPSWDASAAAQDCLGAGGRTLRPNACRRRCASREVSALERELHVRLFERSPQAVLLTSAGVLLVDRARIILAEVDRALADVRTAGGDSRELLTLRVATMAAPVLDGPLRLAALAIDGVEVSMSSGPGDDAVEAVRQGRADAAIVWSRSHSQRDLRGRVLGSVVFGIVLPVGHACSDAATVPVARLAGDVLIMFPRPPFAGIWDRTIDHLFPEGAAAGQVVVEPDLINAPEAMLRAVAAGSGIAVCILGIADQLRIEGVAVRALDPALTCDLEVIWRGPATHAVRRLVDFLVESCRDAQTLIDPGLRTTFSQ